MERAFQNRRFARAVVIPLFLSLFQFQARAATADAPPPGERQARPGRILPALIPKGSAMELILDASGSMQQKIESRTKLIQAKRVMRSFLMEARNEEMSVALRVYGQREKDCKDSKNVLPFGQHDLGSVKTALDGINPVGYGKTPLGLSLRKAGEDLKKFKDRPRSLVVMTDGVETCGEDPCAIAKDLKKTLDIRIFVIGYSLDEAQRKQIKCLGDFGGYFDGSDLNSLARILSSLFGNDKNNLLVDSPDPLAVCELREVESNGRERFVTEFVAKTGVRVEPGTPYRVKVRFKKPYVFEPVTLARNEVKTLKVAGDGALVVKLHGGILTSTLMDQKGKEVKTFPSDASVSVPTGHYRLKLVSPPFVDELVDDVPIFPGDTHVEAIKEIGVLDVSAAPEHGDAPMGYYLFDETAKQELGSYTTGAEVALKSGKYSLSSVSGSKLTGVLVRGGVVKKVTIPPPGVVKPESGGTQTPSPPQNGASRVRAPQK